MNKEQIEEYFNFSDTSFEVLDGVGIQWDGYEIDHYFSPESTGRYSIPKLNLKTIVIVFFS